MQAAIEKTEQTEQTASAQTAGDPVLSITDLSTWFYTRDGVVKSVDGVTLHVNKGECLGIVGESGSGKSVTFSSVLGLVKPPGKIVKGSVVFDGVDLTRLTSEQLREYRGKRIAMTMQDALTALNPSLTVGEQICEVIEAHDDAVRGLPKKRRKALSRERAVEMMRLVGIPSPEKRLENYPHEFSGGMRQRIMIAIALACKPSLLIADEPTTALDVTIQAQVLELISDLRATLSMSVVLITHDLGVVAERCERIMVMYAGHVMESGRTDDIINRPLHPYTQGLLKSMPDIDDFEARVQPIQGTVPSLVDFPEQCRFYSRCPARRDACLARIPDRQFRNGRVVRCIAAEENP